MEPVSESLQREWKGKSAAGGVAEGPVFLYNPKELVLSTRTIGPGQVKEEQAKAASAFRVVELETRKLAGLSGDGEGDRQTAAEILAFHREILKDPQLIADINERIRSDYLPADRAVFQVLRNYIQKLEVSGSRLFKERIPDIVDIRSRLIRHIQQKELIVRIPEKAVVVCREINPSEIILFSRRNAGAVVAEKGGLTSHAAILAKSLGIPFVLDVKKITEGVTAGETIVVDGDAGLVFTRPTGKKLDEVRARYDRHQQDLEERIELSRQPAATKCGHRITLRLNISLEAEIDRSATFGPKGIGLLRTEAYFLEGVEDGTETRIGNNQRRFLERAAELAGENVLTVRLFDVGGDKMPAQSGDEENPALGWRGVRVLLDRPKLLEQQLELVMRTFESFKCEGRILVPMVASVEEVMEIKQTIEKLSRDKKLKPARLGIMVEVPSAVMMAAELASEVDFMSIGTNDLAQYALAADRGNAKVSARFNTTHPAVWRLINQTCEAVKGTNTELSVCGEMASKPSAALVFAGMGIDALSMSGPGIPEVKKALRKVTLELLKNKALHILQCSTSEEVEAVLKSLEAD